MWASFIAFEIEQLSTIFHLAARSNFDAHCVYDRGISGDASSFPNHKPYKHYMERCITLGGLKSLFGDHEMNGRSVLCRDHASARSHHLRHSSPQPGLMMFMWNTCRLQKQRCHNSSVPPPSSASSACCFVLVLEALKQLASRRSTAKEIQLWYALPMLFCVNTFIGLSDTSGERSCLGSWGPSGEKRCLHQYQTSGDQETWHSK